VRKGRILLAAVLLALLGGSFFAYPMYPSPRSLCGIMMDRSKNDDRWASPHRGAVLILNGELYGLPEAGGHTYAYKERCQGYDYFVALDTSPYTLSSIETRNVLGRLENHNWKSEERHAPFTIAARVTSEVQGCFSPPLVLSAMAMQARGDVKVNVRAR